MIAAETWNEICLGQQAGRCGVRANDGRGGRRRADGLGHGAPLEPSCARALHVAPLAGWVQQQQPG